MVIDSRVEGVLVPLLAIFRASTVLHWAFLPTGHKRKSQSLTICKELPSEYFLPDRAQKASEAVSLKRPLHANTHQQEDDNCTTATIIGFCQPFAGLKAMPHAVSRTG